MTTPPKEPAAAGRKVLEGVFGINKPQWASSAGVLRDLQTEFAKSELFQPWLESTRRQMLVSGSKPKHVEKLKVKLGHGGTLDPMATGVLIVGVGRGTKELGKFLECTKSYECVVLFGAATDSYDAVGKVVSKADYAHVTRDLVEEKLKDFRGDIMQKPSIFSALKVDGKKMYEYAREGKDIPAVAARPVTVESLELVEWLEPGTHDFAWPQEEVDEEGRAGAQKLLGIRPSDAAQHQRNTKRARSPSEKEKTPDPDTPVENAGPQPKKPRTDSEPAMSGALPAGPGTDDAQVTQTQDTAAEPETQTNANITHPLPFDIPEPPVPLEKQPATTVEQAFAVDAQNPSVNNPTPTLAPTDRTHQPPAARLRMTVTSGFYVRSLCHDLGLACASLGLMSSLVRTRQGKYELGGERVLEYSELTSGAGWEGKIEGMLEKFMEEEGWEAEELESEESWNAGEGERVRRRKEEDRGRSYRGGRGKYRGGGGGGKGGGGRYSKNMDGGRS